MPSSQDRAAARPDSAQYSKVATLQDSPVRDIRLALAMALFGCFSVVTATVWWIMRAWLKRTSKVFDDQAPELAILDKPETWSPLRAVADEED